MKPIAYLARRPWNTALDRDLARRESADENRQFQLCQIMWSMRHVVLLVAFIHGVGDGSLDRRDALIGGLFVLQAINHVWTRLHPVLAPRITLFDGLALIAAAHLGLPPILVFIVGIAILGWVATFRPLAAISAYLLVASAAVISLLEPPGVPAAHAVTAFCMLGLIFMVRAIRLNMGARASAEREKLVAERIDAIMWEEIPGSGGALKVTPAAERLLGYPVSAWSDGDFLRGIVHPDDRNSSPNHWRAASSVR